MLRYNQGMITIWSILYINPKNKENIIYYHWIKQIVATGVISLGHITAKYIPADIMTNPLGHQNK